MLLSRFRTPLGVLIAGADAEGVRLLEFERPKEAEAEHLESLRRRVKRDLVPGTNDLLARLQARLAEYFAGARRVFDLPLRPEGTPFERRVWDALLGIPYGEVRYYQQIARQIGSPLAVRAVGRANGQNPISILIPCHRVIGKDGSPVGYGGGLHRKEWLLDLELGALRPKQLALRLGASRALRPE